MKQRTFKTLLFLFVIACLSSLLFLPASAAEQTVGDFIFTVDGTSATLKEYKGSDKAVTIPSKVGAAKVTAIGNEAFWGNKTMQTVSIPSTVQVIGTAAFNECTALTKITVPYKVTAIGDAVFWYCTSLKQVVLPKSLTDIGENVFVGCSDKLTVYVTEGSPSETYVKTLSNVKLVYRYMTNLTLSTPAAKLTVGEKKTLSYTYSPSVVYSSKVSYSSSNTAVATVDAKGNITATGVGQATITCKAKDGSDLAATCKVTVVPQIVSTFNLTDVTPTGYTLSWEKSEGATKYRVYKYNSSAKKYETYKYTTEPSITVTDMAVGSYQYYRVMAYASSGGTYYLADVSATYKAYVARPAAVASVTARPAHNYINLSWSKAENATGYKIYSYNRETSKYTYLGAVAKTSCKIPKLTPDTTYTFMVRAYLKYNGKTVNAAYSPLTDCTTRPDYVSGLSVKENSVYTSRVTLVWDALDGAAGYQITMCEEGAASFEAVATLTSQGATEYTVNNLKPGTAYLFKIRAYSQKSGNVLYGYNTKTTLSVTTNDRPANEKEGFNGFIEAYNASKNNQGSFVIIGISDTSGFEGENRESYESVITSACLDGTVYSYITDGTDRVTGLTAKEIISPAAGDADVSFDSVAVTAFEEDGNGYLISFTLSEQDDITQFFEYTAWDKVADENEGFTLENQLYGPAVITAKVQNGYIDNITATVPVTATFLFAGEHYSFTQTYTQTYLFIR